MNRGMSNKSRQKKMAISGISFLLIIALVFTTILGSMVSINIARSDSKADASINYLMDHFEFFNKGITQRMAEMFVSMVGRKNFEDSYTSAAAKIGKADYAGALEDIDKCIGMCGGPQDERYLDLIMKKSCLFVMLGDYTNAETSIGEVLSLNPDSTDALLIQAQIRAELGNYNGLIESLEKYLALNPSDSEIRGLLAQAKFTEENYKAASVEYGKILEDQDDPQILYLYGLTAIQNSAYADGEKSLTEAINKNDSFDGIYYYRGVCRMSLDKYEEAIEDFNMSIEKGQMPEASHYTRAVCSMMLTDYDYEKMMSDLQYAIDGTDEEIKRQAQDLMQKLKTAEEEALKEIQATSEGAIVSGGAIWIPVQEEAEPTGGEDETTDGGVETTAVEDEAAVEEEGTAAGDAESTDTNKTETQDIE